MDNITDSNSNSSSETSTVSSSPSLKHPKSLSCSPSSDISSIAPYRKFSISSPNLSINFSITEEITEIRSDNVTNNNILSRTITTPPVKSHHNNISYAVILS